MTENANPDLEKATEPHVLSRRTLLGAAGAAGIGVALSSLAGVTGAAASTATNRAGRSGPYYWISHLTPDDPFAIVALKGTRQVATDLRVSVKTSLFGGDVAAQEEAITAAIAANAAGIATTSPSPNTIPKLVKKARDAGIPVVTFNSDDTTADRIAYVGADLTTVGVQWAQYLVQNKLVKAGDTVFCPVEVAGASYQVLETTGINSIFAPLHIKADVFEAGSTPAPSTAAMESYLIAHPNVNAMICLGDQVATDVEGVFKALHWPPHKIPVVGWGDTSAIAHSVQAGYMDAAMFQYPDSQGYMPILLLKMVNDGLAAGYNISTSSLYDKTTVAGILKHM